MENLDEKIDTMQREELISLIQEHTSRMGKIIFRFTKQNKRYTVERLDAQYGSHERLLREMTKKLLNIEKTVRRKYVVPMNEDRRRKVHGLLSLDSQKVISKIVNEYTDEYSFVGHLEEFEKPAFGPYRALLFAHASP